MAPLSSTSTTKPCPKSVDTRGQLRVASARPAATRLRGRPKGRGVRASIRGQSLQRGARGGARQYPRVRIAKSDRDQADRAILSVLTPTQVEKRSQNKSALSQGLQRIETQQFELRRNRESVIFRPQIEAVEGFIVDLGGPQDSDDLQCSPKVIHYQPHFSDPRPVCSTPDQLVKWVEGPKCIKVDLDTTTEWNISFNPPDNGPLVEAVEHLDLDTTSSTVSLAVDNDDLIHFNHLNVGESISALSDDSMEPASVLNDRTKSQVGPSVPPNSSEDVQRKVPNDEASSSSASVPSLAAPSAQSDKAERNGERKEDGAPTLETENAIVLGLDVVDHTVNGQHELDVTAHQAHETRSQNVDNETIARAIVHAIVDRVPRLGSRASQIVNETSGVSSGPPSETSHEIDLDDVDSICIKEELDSFDEESSDQLSSRGRSETPNPILHITKSGRKVVRPFTPDLNSASPIQVLKREVHRSTTPEELAEKARQFDLASPASFEEGCMLWARVGGAPYWPCAVINDPDLGIYTRVSHRRGYVHREYHVQFFGKVIQRAWVVSNAIMEYEGIEEFLLKTEAVKNDLKGKKSKLPALKAYCIYGKVAKAAWDEAVEGAEKTLSLSSQERVLQLRNVTYDQPPVPRQRRTSGSSTISTASRKRKRNTSGGTVGSAVSEEEFPAKRGRFDMAEELIQAIAPETLEAHRRKLKTGFKLFQLANLERIRRDSADHTEAERKLGKMWAGVSGMERKFYQEQASNLGQSDPVDDSQSSLQEDDDYVILDSEDEAFNDEASVSSSVKSSKFVEPRQEKENRQPSEMIGVWKKEHCCIICEEVTNPKSDLIKCKGMCGHSFHESCLQIETTNKDDWKCAECASGNHACQICKGYGQDVSRCSGAGCGRFFHVDCLRRADLWPQSRLSDTKFVCPVHMCHTCASDNPKEPMMKYNSRLLKCIRCPTAYHSGDYCVTAGTVQITSSQIVCPKHYTPPPPTKKSSGSLHVNTNWCFLCSKGGSLICCEKCPASFHAECLHISTPDGVFYCDSCEVGRMPLYGEIVWVKLGIYRWWPAKVLHPSEVPANIENLPHEMGEFPIQFCGSKEYFWINQGRCFLYEDGDVDKIPGNNSKGLNGAFKRGLQEALEVFNAYTKDKDLREASSTVKARQVKNLKPPMYTKIKTNRPFGDCPVYTEDASDKTCDCDTDNSSPCGPDSDCLNRYLMVECRPSSCPAKEKCLNQRFTKRIYPKLSVGLTQARGWGLVVGEDVKKGDFIIEYVGELITNDEFQTRLQTSLIRKEESNFYYMTMDNHRMIDAGPKGNIARFMNHSCDPNCETQKWTVNGDTRVGLFAKEDIKVNSELTFNYQFEALGEVKTKCLCGAHNCSGFIGEKPKDGKNVNGNGLKKKKGKSKRSKKKVWEDLCFRCMDDGQLLMCDYKTCPKVYHLECLGREKMPREKWFCPWHHCVHCGKLAVNYCMHCPNAYCKTHDTAVENHAELGNICDEHEDDFEDLLNFYNKVGGISKLVPHPNVPMEEPSNDALLTPNGVKKPLTEIQSSNSSDETPPPLLFPLLLPQDDYSSEKKRCMCKCIEIDCAWQGKKSRFFDHLVRRHNLSPEVSQRKVRLVLNSMIDRDPYTDENDEMSPSLTPNGSDYAKGKRIKERLKICPESNCQLIMRASNIGRHIKTRHPKMDESMALTAQYDESSFNGDSNDQIIVDPVPSPSQDILNGSLKNSGKERLKVCPIEECATKLRASNMSRHIKSKHPDFDESIAATAVFDPELSMDDSLQMDNSFNDTDLFEGDEATHDKFGKERLFTCKYCGVSLRASNLRRHIKARHEREDGQNPIYLSPSDGSSHPAFGLSGRRVQVKCPACDLVLRPSNFNRHWARRHPAQPLPNVNERRQLYLEDDGEGFNEDGMAISVEPVFYGEGESSLPFNMEDESDGDESLNGDGKDGFECHFGTCHFVASNRRELAVHRRTLGHPKPGLNNSVRASEGEEMLLIEPEVHLSTPSFESPASRPASNSKHIPARMRELKYRCDTCGYVSRFRQNLDRHCKKRSHYSEYLIKTSKTPHIYVQAPSENNPGPSRTKMTQSSEPEDILIDPAVLTPQIYMEDEIASEDDMLEDMSHCREATVVDPVVDDSSNESLLVDSVDESSEESEAVTQAELKPKHDQSHNNSSFCNFDLNGILGDSSSEDDDLGIINIDYKVL